MIRRLNTHTLLAIILATSMVLAAGCIGTGWGQDGPAEAGTENGSEEPQIKENNGTTASSNGDDSSGGNDAGDGAEPPSATESGDSSPTIDTGSEEERQERERIRDAARDAVEDANNQESTERSGGTETNGSGTERSPPDRSPSSDEKSKSGTENETEFSPTNGAGEDTQDSYTYSLTVQVVDEQGNPLENELVQFDRPGYTDDEKIERITDANGRATVSYKAGTQDEYLDYQYTVRGEPRGETRVDVSDQTERVVVDDNSERETYDLEVHAGETYPVENVDITLERQADGATVTKTTGESGTVTFTVYPGDYRVTGVNENGEQYTEEVSVEQDQELFIPIE